MKYLVYDYFEGSEYESSGIYNMCVIEAETEEEAYKLGADYFGFKGADREGLLVLSFNKLVHGFEII